MSLRLARRIAKLAAPLDPVSDALQTAVNAVPQSLRNVLDGTWLGVPLHPPLTDVPLGSWTAAMVLDALEPVADDDGFGRAADAALAVGCLGALGAAATGINDWAHLRGDSKRLGTVHAILNSAGLALNVASLALRRSGRRDLAKALSGVALGGAYFSAHLGGELSFGMGVRVNRTAFDSPPDEFTPVLAESELQETELRRVDLRGEAVLVTRAQDGRICAIAATCSHLGGPLDEGEREGDSVICPWHGSKFDLCTGEYERGPAVFPQPRYECRVSDGMVELRVAER